MFPARGWVKHKAAKLQWRADVTECSLHSSPGLSDLSSACDETSPTGPTTDKSRPHNFALTAIHDSIHDAIQSCATHTVVIGDKEAPEVYQYFNTTAARSDGTPP